MERKQEFFGLEEMADIGPRIIAARIALAAFFDGMEIVGILGVAQGQAARMGHGHAVAGNARREDAVEHIDAAGDAFEQVIVGIIGLLAFAFVFILHPMRKSRENKIAMTL